MQSTLCAAGMSWNEHHMCTTKTAHGGHEGLALVFKITLPVLSQVSGSQTCTSKQIAAVNTFIHSAKLGAILACCCPDLGA